MDLSPALPGADAAATSICGMHLQAKEDEKMQAFRALLQKGPITIAKRQ
jgi:hypothetical protein